MNGTWRKLSLECVYDFQSFVNIPDIQWQIIGLAKEVGVGEVDEKDVVQLLESHGEDLNEDLIKLEQ